MIPQMQPQPPSDTGNDAAAAITKHVNAIVQSLALLYKECHQATSDQPGESPLCAAVMNVSKAMSAIEQHIKTLGFHSDEAAQPAPPVHAGPPMGGSPFAGPAAGLHADMMAAANRRLP